VSLSKARRAESLDRLDIKSDRPLVVERMLKADAVMKEIHAIVETWEDNGEDDREKIWTPEEWLPAQQIKEKLMVPGKRTWENNEPWKES